jgi:hypothetical protein
MWLQIIVGQLSQSNDKVVATLMAELAASKATLVQAQLEQSSRIATCQKEGHIKRDSDMPMDLLEEPFTDTMQGPSSMYSQLDILC